MKRFTFDATDSTNTQALRLAAEHPGLPLLVVAREQTAGRGRLGREWRSPVGGAWFSLAWPLRSDIPASRYQSASVITGYAVLRTLRHFLNKSDRGPLAELHLKWPNDILLDGGKVCGILCESRPPAVLVIGVGINVNLDPAALGDNLRFPAASLQSVAGRTFDLDALIDRAVYRIQTSLTILEAGDIPEPELRLIESHLAWLNQHVTLRDGQRTLQGFIRGLDPAGRLLLECDGRILPVDAGEIDHAAIEKPQSLKT